MNLDRIYTLYMHTNNTNNKKYIGITMQKPASKRWGGGCCYCKQKYFYNAIQKYGWDGFRHEIIFQNLTKQEAEMFEIEMIKYYKSNSVKFGYNVDNGGNSVGKRSDATKKKISEIKKSKNFKHTEESKMKMREASLGHPSSEKQKLVASILNKGDKNYFYGKDFSGNKNGMYGKTHTEEVKEKLRKLKTGVHGLDHPSSKKILCVETGIIYDNITIAAKEMGVCISWLCTAHKKNKKAAGYHWRLV